MRTTRRLRARGPRLVAPGMLLVALLAAACSGNGTDAGTPLGPTPLPPATPPPATGPVTATVSSCSQPFNQGTTTIVAALRLHSAPAPLHLVNVFRTAVYRGDSGAAVSGGTASPMPGTGETRIEVTGPTFDRVVFEHATLEAEGQQTVHADSASGLAGKRFDGPFGEARVLNARISGSTVVVRIASPQRPARGTQNIGPQAAALQVGSDTLAARPVSSSPKGSQYVNTFAFAGSSPPAGAATLTVSQWRVIDIGDLTIVLPAHC